MDPDGSPAPLDACDDRELMRRHVAGDADVFGEIFRRHRDRMWAVAVSTCRDPELAADAVQDAFLSAFRRADSYRGDAAVTTWLHRIVVNACLDRLRRVRPTSELPETEIADTRDRPAEVDTRLAVQAALGELPEAQRLALVLVDMHAVPVSEAARILGVAEGTVKSRCSRGRAALAELLGPTVLDRGTSDPLHASDPGDRAPRSSSTRSARTQDGGSS